MSGSPSDCGATEVLRGFGLRGAVGRRVGVAAFLGVQIALTVWLMWSGYQRDQRHPVGYAVFAILAQLGLATVWFFVSTRSNLSRYTAMACLFTMHGAIVVWHAPSYDDWFRVDEFTSVLSFGGGLWLAPLAAVMCVLRHRGLRMVAIGSKVRFDVQRWSKLPTGVFVAGVVYVAANVLWVNEVADWISTGRLPRWAIVYPQLVYLLGAAFAVLALFAALDHHRAPWWFLILVAAVALLWLLVLALFAARGDLTVVRIRRDSVAVLSGFAPYLHFLWFRALGYRVAFVAADD